MRYLGISAKSFWMFIISTFLIGIAIIMLTLGGLRRIYGVDAALARCRTMVANLENSADPQALRRDSAEVLRRFTEGGTHRVPDEQIPDSIKRVMKIMNLSEVVICEGHILRLATPAGFGGYGVDIVPEGGTVAVQTNTPGLTQLQWEDGVYVWDFSP